MSLALAPAEASARAAMARATSLGIAICVAVCDGQGRLTVFFKMDATTALAGHEAIRRAITSAGTGLASDGAAQEPNRAKSASDEGFGISSRPGGIPLFVDAEILGGVGVCGGTAFQDVDCARVGAVAFRA